MNRIRLGMASVTVALLAAGYVASQFAYLGGQSADYAARIDQAPIIFLSLVLFLTAIAFCFWHPPEDIDS